MFCIGVGFNAREGSRVHLWLDVWVVLYTLCQLYTRLFRVVSNKESTVKDYYVWVGNSLSWRVGFRRVSRQLEVLEYESISMVLTFLFAGM